MITPCGLKLETMIKRKQSYVNGTIVAQMLHSCQRTVADGWRGCAQLVIALSAPGGHRRQRGRSRRQCFSVSLSSQQCHHSCRFSVNLQHQCVSE